MKNKKIIFNLTIDDLKELGIIRKRKRRQRKIKYVNGIPSNIKSVSNHMTGYTNEFKNTDNLKTENLRLQNDVLTQYPQALKLQSGYEDRFNNIDEQYNNTRKIYENILAQTYRSRIQNNNLDDDDTLSSDTRVERLSSRYGDPDDDIDVPQTGGSDAWQGYDNVIDDPEPQQIVSPQQEPQQESQQESQQEPPQIISPQQAGIRSPLSMFGNRFRAPRIVPVDIPVDNNGNLQVNVPMNMPADDESSIDINNVVNSSDGGGYNYQFAEEDNEKKSDTPNNPEVNTQQVTTPEEEEQYTPLTQENLEIHTGTTNQQPALTKNQIKYQKDKANLIQAKQEYIDAGGKDSIILAPSYRNLGAIRAATILLQNTTKKKGKKNKK